MAVTVVLTPVLQKAEKCRFYQEIGGCYKGTIILKNSVPVRRIPFKCILYVLKKHLCEEKMNAKFHWHYITVWSINHISGTYKLWAEMVWAEMVMGRNGHGPNWPVTIDQFWSSSQVWWVAKLCSVFTGT